MKKFDKLDQLTSLRFFAALMIVIHHSAGMFGIKNVGVNWGQGVSFFFVLSGFILTYVYPRLENLVDVRRFWRARVARIYPAYVASFVLAFILVPFTWDARTAIPNLLMIQSWIPMSIFYFSYNAAAWSVSTEVFFYLAYPLLIYKWNKYWVLKSITASIVLILLMHISNQLELRDYGNPYVGSDGLLVTEHGLIYIHPASRIFEFILGMVVATLWLKKKGDERIGWSTFLEAIALIICAASMYYGTIVAEYGKLSFLGHALWQWLIHSGSLFSFGLLIYVMANGIGLISKILANRLLVLLGEISLSMYLIHQTLLTVYTQNAHALSSVPNVIALLFFTSFLLTSSYLMWVCIEMPGRRLLLSGGRIHGTSAMKMSWHEHKVLSKKTAIAGIVLLLLGSMFYITVKQY